MSGIGFFIDHANLSIEWRRVSQGKIDFAKLRSCIEQHCNDKIVEAYCFDATEDGLSNAYFGTMRRSGIRVKLYRFAYEDVYDGSRQPVRDKNGEPVRRKIQKGVDVGLALQLVDSHRRRGWTKLVLAAADSDFEEPVRQLVEIDNVELTILGIPERVSNMLLPYASDTIDLRRVAQGIELDCRPPLNLVTPIASMAPA